MLVGHLGAAMALNRLDRRINLGFVVLASMLLDILLWIFVAIGWERVIVPRDYADKHYLLFDFPYSHSLMSTVLYAVIAAVVAWFFASRFSSRAKRVALIIGAAVASHWLLDFLVHLPDLPLLSDVSTKVGLSLWQHIGVALALESLIAAGGAWLYIGGADLTRSRKIGLISLVGLLVIFTIVGQVAAPPPENIGQVAAVSLALNLAIAVVAFLLTRRKSVAQAEPA